VSSRHGSDLSGSHPMLEREQVEPWDSDHTALVHVLWASRREGLSLDDFDELASRIMRSKWMHAVRLHARDRANLIRNDL
jgi:hypothetical protein